MAVCVKCGCMLLPLCSRWSLSLSLSLLGTACPSTSRLSARARTFTLLPMPAAASYCTTSSATRSLRKQLPRALTVSWRWLQVRTCRYDSTAFAFVILCCRRRGPRRHQEPVRAGAGDQAVSTCFGPHHCQPHTRACRWFNGPIALSGSISTGGAVLAAQVPPLTTRAHVTSCAPCFTHSPPLQAMGADFGYVGSAFIATHEARASDEYAAPPLPAISAP